MQTEKTTITLLKPFVFSEPPQEGQKLPVEHKFMPKRDDHGRFVPTDIEVDPWIAEHPYIAEQYADGAIESPDQRAARQQVIDAQAAKRKQEDDKANADAAKAIARATGSAQRRAERDDATNGEINTPVNEAAIKQGEGLSTGAPVVDESALTEELNTPINVLRQRQAEKVRNSQKK